MNQKRRKRVSFVLFLIFLAVFFCWRFPALADTFFGEAPTGLLEITDYKYPVYLFVPPNYKPDRSFPLIVTVPGEGESPEKNIQFWQGLAKRKGLIVVAPTNIWPRELPAQNMDDWILKIKNDIGERYQVAQNKIFLIGKEGGTPYAAYLGIRYPEEFSAVALIGGSWVGRYENIIRLETSPRKQRPFFVALKDEDPALVQKTETKALEFEKNGYPIYLIKLTQDEKFDSDEFKKKVLDWLEDKSQDWLRVTESRQKTLKEKMSVAKEEFFHL